MPYCWTGMAVICCVGVLASCGSGTVQLRPTAVSDLSLHQLPTQTGTGVPMSGSTAPSGVIGPTVQGRDNEMADLQTCILRHWIHSHEEDAQGVMVYRPAGYEFPPSRGRVGFDFREGGDLIYYGIGRADGSEQFSGSWVIEGPNLIRINVNSERIQPFVLQVVSCDDLALKVRR